MEGKKITLLIGVFFTLSIIVSLVSTSAEIELNRNNFLEGISDKNVKFDIEILDSFNFSDSEKDDFIRGNLSDVSSNVEMVHVTVDVKDSSNIVMDYKGDSIEEQTDKDNRRWDAYRNTSEAILSTLSEEEFQQNLIVK